MTRESRPFGVPDLAPFARALGRGLKAHLAEHEGRAPGHVQTLNLIARAAGHRNLQAMLAEPVIATPAAPAVAEAPAGPPPLTPLARKTLGQFDADGRLVRWPVKYSVQKLAMWVLWTRFAARRVYTEKEVNAILKAANAFGDHVTLRRELINHRLLTRTPDCAEYRKLPARPDDEARALLNAWRAQQR